MADTTVGLHLDACVFSFPEEDALLTGLRHGDEQAYEILIQRYQQPVYNLVCRLMNDPSDASDIVQEVFLKVFRSIRSFRHGSSLKTHFPFHLNGIHLALFWLLPMDNPEEITA